MSAEELDILAPDRRLHGEAVIDVVAKVFSHGGYFESRDRFREKCGPRSHCDWGVTRIGLVGERVVTHWGVWDYRMRIGRARVRVGGIGNVATHADFRERGFMTRTGQASIDAMRDAGYDLSILYGRPNFYHRFGYVRAFPEQTYVVGIDHLSPDRPTVRLHRASRVRLEEFHALYNREHARLTGTAVRPTYGWPRPWRPPVHARYWTDGKDRVAGYGIVSEEGHALRWHDSAGDVEEVLRVVASLARRHACREVRFKDLHWDHLLARRLREGTCRIENQHVSRGGPMVLTLSLRGTLEKMAGELGRRLRASDLASWRGRLLVADAREKVALAINRGKVSVAERAKTRHALRGGDEMARLLIGSDSPDEVVREGGMRLSGDARRLVRALFAAQHPRLGGPDRF
jgi:predicted N-acetyltransferase YhbS